MKTIKEGTIPEPAAPWWVGEILTCTNCGHQVELEEGDPIKIVQERRPGGAAVITIDACPTCGLAITKTFHNVPGASPQKKRSSFRR